MRRDSDIPLDVRIRNKYLGLSLVAGIVLGSVIGYIAGQASIGIIIGVTLGVVVGIITGAARARSVTRGQPDSPDEPDR
ncbi:hypothetical protein MJA45_22460 [Paenibacillus aurantius]|uniref:Glycine zipper family protein n=1 Tax=Paenibacillus aurantius TaxID=2918900 RepID=A0AA96LB44_9BACL|nr:hypothetical protein [Paenibacillus aurantius]WJH35098.1 hypothetical protein N6H14_02990 [Paenibacillus sp. CC-CFT747]WNQ10357.1 hypothetical protein MJA45_22460 [Paenibacillus aurantius]